MLVGKNQCQTSTGRWLEKIGGIFLSALCLVGTPVAVAEESRTNGPILANLSFEQLSQIEITTLSRRPERLADTPAAATVLSGEDILRSGAKSVPEALRQVPGLMVGQVDANSWAISSRGFNSEFGSKMLVMIDGRSVYEPLLSMTFWDVQNVMLEDLEKIEVVRGPGSTLWGANAVNGVINIVTKNARDTQGVLAYGGGGSPQEALAGARYGGQLGSNTFYRVYGFYQQSDAFPLDATGQDGRDRWGLGQGGFRIDHELADGARLTWQGDGYYEEVPDGGEMAKGANTLALYQQDFSDTAGLELQAYYTYTRRETLFFETPRQVADIDFQNYFALGERQSLLWGLGYRMNTSEYEAASSFFVVNQSTLTTHLYSGFIEDEIQLVPEVVTLTPGCKIEHNDMTGWETQPGIRLGIHPAAGQLLWASVTRAVRTPGEGEHYGVFSYPYPGGTYWPDGSFDSETMIAYETGYRWQISKKLSADVSAYYNDYDGVVAYAPNGEILPSGSARVTPQNLISGGIYGGELSLTYRPVESWRLTAWYALCLSDLFAPPAGQAQANLEENRIPTHQAYLRSSLDIARNWQFDVQFRFVDDVVGAPAYVEVDIRLACQLGAGLELALVGQNLLHESHPEFRPAAGPSVSAVPRGGYAKLTWRF